MFYSQDILQKRGGKFGIIWIAATRARDLTRRDYSTVNVAKTCDEIINHLTQPKRVRYDRSGFPRFSLYLSAQLMFGVTLVHRKHAEYLYGDAMTLQSKFIPKRPGRRIVPGSTEDIDMKTSTRPIEALRLEDPLDLYRPGLLELDPEFGRLNVTDDIMEPAFLPDIDIIHFPLDPPTPEWWPGRRKSIRKPSSSSSPSSFSDHDPYQVRNARDISIPDVVLSPEPFQVSTEDDLQPPQPGDLLDKHLSSSEEAIPPDDQPALPPAEKPGRKRPEGKGDREEPAPKRKRPGDGKRKDPSDPRGPEEEQPPPEPERQPMVESPPAPDHQPSDEERRSSPSELELPPIPREELLQTPPGRRTRPGRGPKIDQETQLSREDVRNSLAHPEHTLAPMVRANPKPPPTAEQLFNQPCRRVHHPALLRLWQRNATVQKHHSHWSRQHPAEDGPQPSSPEEEREGPEVSKEGREAMRDDPMEDSTSKRPGMDVTGESMTDVSLSDQGSAHRPMPGQDIPTRRRPTDQSAPPFHNSIPEEGPEMGPEPELPAEPETLPPMEEPEVSPQQEAPVSDSADSSGKGSHVSILCETMEPHFSPRLPVKSKLSRDEANSTIAESLGEDNVTTFCTLASPEETDKPTAARFFYFCLVFQKEQKIQLNQEAPYKDIVIERGPRFTAMLAAAGFKH
ncbi:meiotic recombination protein REC8 homolog isoform X1 [Branchiostoma lanceolatum]|uniref:meiotic recombination protein REC8 homolog isoform X1 n=1 Tax=Branchiostoma lanceolatum TaxID=7740 RepID=UPI0034562142